jgi:Protein of unknown function (DUF3108)
MDGRSTYAHNACRGGCLIADAGIGVKNKRTQSRWIMLLAALITSSAIANDSLSVKPFSGNYSVVFRGIHAGNIDFVLRRATNNDPKVEASCECYVYESLAHPTGLARLLIHHTVRESSTFKVDNGEIKPIYYEFDDGSSDTSNDTRLDFDWKSNRARGIHEDHPIELPLSAGVQDRMSAQVITIKSLLAGSLTETMTFIDRDELKVYSYKQVRTEQLKTAIGEFNTVVIESSRPESDRVSRLWYAPSLGYIPVRGEQQRKGKVETVFEIQSLNQPSAH